MGHIGNAVGGRTALADDNPKQIDIDFPDGQSKFPHLWPPQIPPGKTGRIMTTRC